MSAFKKKSQVPETISDLNKKMSLLLGISPQQSNNKSTTGIISKDLILACAMFWDTKQRIDKIKGLILKQQQLQSFEDVQDFKIQELQSIQLLSLSRNSIIHLQPISCLSTLICLNINYNKVYDISPLQQLKNLEQLYAANNKIKNIQPLNNLTKLRILNLYSNNVQKFDESIKALKQLKALEQLDIQQNPMYEQKNKQKFIQIQNLSRLNGELIFRENKEDKQMSASCVVIPSAKFRDTHTSFWNSKSNQKKQNPKQEQKTCSEWSVSNKNLSYQSVMDSLRNKVRDLQLNYLEIDDKFETQIAKNVQLKSAIHQKVIEKQQKQRKKQQMKDKMEEMKCLKRKVKALKENIFNPQISGLTKNKCELLRQIFELQMIKQNNSHKANTQIQKIDHKKQMKLANKNLWVRKFDYDEQMIITQTVKSCKQQINNNDDKYFLDQDDEIEHLLENNTSAIEDLKKQLQELSSRQ